jgi:hypothetical protein
MGQAQDEAARLKRTKSAPVTVVVDIGNLGPLQVTCFCTLETTPPEN